MADLKKEDEAADAAAVARVADAVKEAYSK